MPRNMSGVYSLPAGSLVTDGVDDIEASQHNTPLQDLTADANAPRPIVAGGTGANSATDARTNLGLGTMATQTAGTAGGEFRTNTQNEAAFVTTAASDQTVAGAKTFTSNIRAPGLRATTAGSAAAPSHTWDSDGDTGFFNPSGNEIGVTTNGTEVARFIAGQFLVGRTTAIPLDGPGSGNEGVQISAPNNSIIAYRNGNPSGIFGRQGSNGSVLQFRRSGDIVGGVSLTTVATSFDTTSDPRLKDAAETPADWSPSERIASIAGTLRHYTWKATGELAFGAFADELQAVAPYAVTGEKDAVDEEGNIAPMGVDWSKLVPELIAALDEALKRIAILEAK